jgi:hypothetical protein
LAEQFLFLFAQFHLGGAQLLGLRREDQLLALAFIEQLARALVAFENLDVERSDFSRGPNGASEATSITAATMPEGRMIGAATNKRGVASPRPELMRI